MPHYTPPVKDQQFILHDVLKVSESDVPGYDELDREFTGAVLEEAGKIAANTEGAEDPAIDMSMLKAGARLPLPPEVMTRKLSDLADQIGEAGLATVSEAGLAPDAVNRLVLVGGSSLMRVVEEALTTRFPNAQVHRGAALTAIVDGLALSTAR